MVEELHGGMFRLWLNHRPASLETTGEEQDHREKGGSWKRRFGMEVHGGKLRIQGGAGFSLAGCSQKKVLLLLV